MFNEALTRPSSDSEREVTLTIDSERTSLIDAVRPSKQALLAQLLVRAYHAKEFWDRQLLKREIPSTVWKFEHDRIDREVMRMANGSTITFDGGDDEKFESMPVYDSSLD